MNKGNRTVESVEIRAAKPSGFVSETRYKTARGGQGGGPSFDHNSEPGAHPNLEHVGKHLAAIFHAEAGTDKPGGKYNEKDRGGPDEKSEAAD